MGADSRRSTVRFGCLAMTAIASFKALTRDACGQALALSGITAPAVRLRQRLSIITFHRVLTESQRALYPLPGLAVTPNELDAHLKFATRHFRCLSLTAALDLWADGQYSGPPLLAITFDDGQLDNYENALPVLEQNQVTASFYIPSQILDDSSPLWHDALATSIGLLNLNPGTKATPNPDSSGAGKDELIAQLHAAPGHDRSPSHTDIEAAIELTKAWSTEQRWDWIHQARKLLPHPDQHRWDGFMNVAQMKELIARGHEIGSHSHSHPLLPQCTREELVAEIMGSKQKLEAALDAPVTTFCYPNGSVDPLSVEHVRKAGYRAAVTTQWGSNSPGHDPFQLQRFDMNAKHAKDRKGRFSEARLAWRMSGLHPGLTRANLNPYSGASA
jgi:peptidoglycan/xylan/chitin deacetylase (PgdA/CDA1 family)